GLTTVNISTNEVDDQLIQPQPPGAPVLSINSDTGDSNSDHLTNLNNSSAGKKLTFFVSGIASGSTARIYADGVLIGSALSNSPGGVTPTAVVTDGSTAMGDGTHQITVRQIKTGQIESEDSPALAITIDTIGPVPTITQFAGQTDPTSSGPIKFVASFNQSVTAFNPSFFTVSGTAGATVGAVTGSNGTYTITISNFALPGTVVVNMAAGACHDAAGNLSVASVNTDNSVTLSVNNPVVTPFATLVNGRLTFTGTNSNDVMSLSVQGSNLVATLNGESETFNNSAVARIDVFALDGNDRVTVGANVIGTYVLGGNGNDYLVGGNNNDSLTGASGKDTLIGNAGDDNLNGGKHGNVIFGGAGNDRIYGGDGLDSLDGGDGNDRMYGNTSPDIMLGGNGNDTIYGEAGNDKIDGGANNDHIFGGAGNDSITGGVGNDVIEDQDSTVDTINGNGGTDSVRADLIDLLIAVERPL
ncbi:MAG TPA: hypothetical protein VHD56_09285, partial [Tepidisphaeraceae bacterium]|nr:hypothetical protein [Tepidisphaeraceae bacterium]